MKKADALEAKMNSLNKELRKFQDAADDARDKHTYHHKRAAEAEAKIRFTKKAIADFEAEENPYRAMIKKAQGEIGKAEDIVAKKKKLLKRQEAKAERVAYWVQGFRNIRLYLIQELLDELQAMMAIYLPQVGLEGWVCEFAVEREMKSGSSRPGLHVSIKKPGNANAVRWESWSGGEGQRLRIVGAIALSEVLLRRAGIECDLLIFDEPTRHLSSEGVRETCEFLIDRGRDHQVFLVDHTAIENKGFAGSILISRSRKGARIDF